MLAAMTVPVYADQPFSATDLNRRSGKVLDAAVNSPVTIVRNDQYFALTSRAFMTDMSRSLAYLKEAMAVLSAISKLRGGASFTESDPYFWLCEFTPEDLQDFSDEIHQVSVASKDLEELGAILHEWRQSGLAMLSGKAKNLMSKESQYDLGTGAVVEALCPA